MEARHHLEEALQKAIEKKEKELCESLIPAFNKTKEASLSSVDGNNRSFLFLALEHELESIADILLALQEDNEDIIFGKDQQKRTVFHMAISKDYKNIAEKLLRIAKEKNKLALLFDRDSDGMNPLHYAALGWHDEEVIALLLDVAKKRGEFNKIINCVDKDGDIALHKAIKLFPLSQYAVHLINAGANINLHNNDGHSSFILICKMSPEKQIKLFAQLNKEKQEFLLYCYQDYVLKEPQSEKIKSIYFKCAALVGLKHSIVARLETEQHVPARDSYLSISRKKEINDGKEIECHDENGGYLVETVNKLLSTTNILETLNLPHYAARINCALSKNEMENDFCTRDHNKQLDSDRETITNLIDDIETYLASLNHSHVSLKNRALSIIIPVVLMISFFGMETWFHEMEKSSTRLSEKRFYCFSGLLIGLFGAVPFMAQIPVIWKTFWNKEMNISSDQWQAIIDKLQEELLSKLQFLEQNQHQENGLPTQAENIRELEKQIYELNHVHSFIGDISAKSQPISQVINIFTRLKNILDIIRKDLNINNKLISFFSEPKVSAIENTEDTSLTFRLA